MLADKVIDVIAETQDIPRETISLDTKFDELDLDSLAGLNLLFEIESTYDVDIDLPNDRLGDMRDVRGLVTILEEALPSETIQKIISASTES